MSPSYWGELSVLWLMLQGVHAALSPIGCEVAGSFTAFSPRACRKGRWKQVCVHQMPQCHPPQHVLSLLPYLGQSCQRTCYVCPAQSYGLAPWFLSTPGSFLAPYLSSPTEHVLSCSFVVEEAGGPWCCTPYPCTTGNVPALWGLLGASGVLPGVLLSFPHLKHWGELGPGGAAGPGVVSKDSYASSTQQQEHQVRCVRAGLPVRLCCVHTAGHALLAATRSYQQHISLPIAGSLLLFLKTTCSVLLVSCSALGPPCVLCSTRDPPQRLQGAGSKRCQVSSWHGELCIQGDV